MLNKLYLWYIHIIHIVILLIEELTFIKTLGAIFQFSSVSIPVAHFFCTGYSFTFFYTITHFNYTKNLMMEKTTPGQNIIFIFNNNDHIPYFLSNLELTFHNLKNDNINKEFFFFFNAIFGKVKN